jgi:3-oxoacyl-[acyl-carrier-protein] synthase II
LPGNQGESFVAFGNPKRRVVVTGLGIVCPIGNSPGEAWANALAGKSGIARITRFDPEDEKLPIACHIAGEVKDFSVDTFMPAKEARHMDVFMHYGIAAGIQAFKDSGLEISEANRDNIGVNVGSGIGGLPMIEDNHNEVLTRGPRRISPFMIPGAIINMIAGNLSIMFGLQGPNFAIVSACTTGLHSLGIAARLIEHDDADVMIAGGSEGTVCSLGVGGFAAMQALSVRNDDPAAASRPFDKDRDGFVLGEGAGVVVLEELAHAQARGARIYCELVGFGMTADAHHMTLPDVDGPRRSMVAALRSAQVNPDQIQYLNAHGTSTPPGDVNETNAIKLAFGDVARSLVVNSTKSMTGHLLGGAGGVESVFTALAVFHQVSPPTINLQTPDPDCDLDYCANQARPMRIDYAMKNSFGFGGTNGTLVFKRV